MHLKYDLGRRVVVVVVIVLAVHVIITGWQVVVVSVKDWHISILFRMFDEGVKYDNIIIIILDVKGPKI